jgi:hypothetical protein
MPVAEFTGHERRLIEAAAIELLDSELLTLDRIPSKARSQHVSVSVLGKG